MDGKENFDVTVVCDGRDFSAHRSVLSSVSPYFESLFRTGAGVVPQDGVGVRVPLNGVPAGAMQVIVEYLYRGNLNSVEGNVDRLLDLLPVADFLQMSELVYRCTHLCADILRMDRFHRAWLTAERHDNTELTRLVLAYLAANFRELASHPDFGKLTGIQLRNVLRSDDLVVSSAKQAVEGIVNWANAQNGNGCEQQQVDDLADLLHAVDLERLPTPCLRTLVDRVPAVGRNPEVCRRLQAVLNDRMQACGSKKPLMMVMRNAAVGDGGTEVTVLDVNSREPVFNTTLPQLSLHTGMALTIDASRGRVYLAGGTTKPFGQHVYVYLTVSNMVSCVGLLTVEAICAGAAVLGDQLYVVGGMHRNCSAVQRMHVGTGECTLMAPTLASYPCPEVFPYNDTHLVLVGRECMQHNAIIEEYDSSADQWTLVTLVPSKVDRCCATLNGSTLVVAATNGCVNRVRSFDMARCEWLVCGVCDLRWVQCLWTVPAGDGEPPTLLARNNHSEIMRYREDVGEWERLFDVPNESYALLV